MHDPGALTREQLGFVGGRLDRVDHIRARPDLAAQTFALPETRIVALDGLDPVTADGHLVMEAAAPGARAEDHVLLGLDDLQRPIFARLAEQVEGGFFPTERSRAIATELPAHEIALYGTARSLVHWHARHRFCSVCGSPTQAEKAGWSRRCGACSSEHFPRVDPVAIMLAEHDGRVLLGRQHRWPERFYSALAGFIEPGETIEEAVAREIKEEAGVTVHSVRYVMSQPWPFPSSLMVACIGVAGDDALTLDETEIEHAFWCDADGVRAALANEPGAPFIAPPPMAVARHLLKHWLDGQLVPPGPSA
ncbi:NAD(+) diphosphatase [Sphingobium sp. DC-2]|uniref:NAD(+) diphosphatase n=1 Tax=Sphingobium sp. DC-2 TaxID=1303256 RepID=UPI0004C470AE|nr:NAD(+) diphosphatase [Sphingobium sp. DC-2]